MVLILLTLGTLVSQLSTSRSGMKALCETGWIKSYISDLFDLLEFENSMSGSMLDTNGENYFKSVSNILKVFSTFSGISSCLEFEENTSEERGSLTHLMKFLVLVDKSEIADLVNFEESHQTGINN